MPKRMRTCISTSICMYVRAARIPYDEITTCCENLVLWYYCLVDGSVSPNLGRPVGRSVGTHHLPGHVIVGSNNIGMPCLYRIKRHIYPRDVYESLIYT